MHHSCQPCIIFPHSLCFSSPSFILEKILDWKHLLLKKRNSNLIYKCTVFCSILWPIWQSYKRWQDILLLTLKLWFIITILVPTETLLDNTSGSSFNYLLTIIIKLLLCNILGRQKLSRILVSLSRRLLTDTISEKWKWNHSVMSDSLCPHGL